MGTKYGGLDGRQDGGQGGREVTGRHNKVDRVTPHRYQTVTSEVTGRHSRGDWPT